jgi:hypothetical protein
VIAPLDTNDPQKAGDNFDFRVTYKAVSRSFVLFVSTSAAVADQDGCPLQSQRQRCFW